MRPVGATGSRVLRSIEFLPTRAGSRSGSGSARWLPRSHPPVDRRDGPDGAVADGELLVRGSHCSMPLEAIDATLDVRAIVYELVGETTTPLPTAPSRCDWVTNSPDARGPSPMNGAVQTFQGPNPWRFVLRVVEWRGLSGPPEPAENGGCRSATHLAERPTSLSDSPAHRGLAVDA
jgi:hypothetical protein